MSTLPAVRMDGLSKRYRIGQTVGGYGRLTESIAAAVRRRGRTMATPETFWALKDVSLEIAPGEVVGFVGRNGAGKTTLLKVLSRITEPTAGRADIYGRVGALLEVGTGFHPELSGRENIALNGAILGMGRREVQGKFDEIVEFAGVERFIDTPVKRYSSGMYVRLAFAVAAHLEPDILIIDEVLAVGDDAFQKKCLGKMNDVAREGRTVLFVSHNMGAVRSLCTRAVFLEAGQVVCDGAPDIAIRQYLDRLHTSPDLRLELEADPDVPAQVTAMWLEDASGDATAELELGADATLVVEYAVRQPLRDLTMAMLLSRDGTPLLYSYDTDADPSLRDQREPGAYIARVPLITSELKEGTYNAALAIGYAKENLTDDRASLQFTIVNRQRDLTHRSYRGDRPGALMRDLPWNTRRRGD